MRLIVFSNPEKSEQESEMINTLFDYGLECLHIRKPSYLKEELGLFIEAIEEQHHEKLVLHSHYELAEKYKVRGVHFTRSFIKNNSDTELKNVFETFKNSNFSVSRTTHSFSDIDNLNLDYTYVFLSPIFDSISKTDYKSNFDLAEVYVNLKNKKINTKVIALGGLNEKNIETALSCGFDGIAVLGTIWKTELVEIPRKFKRMRFQVNEHFDKKLLSHVE